MPFNQERERAQQCKEDRRAFSAGYGFRACARDILVGRGAVLIDLPRHWEATLSGQLSSSLTRAVSCLPGLVSLLGWLVAWLVGWLVGWSASLVGWLVGWWAWLPTEVDMPRWICLETRHGAWRGI